MYSDELQELLDQHGIEPGDTVTVTAATTSYTGTVMPRSRQGNTDALVIKLDNGYNIGIDRTSIESIEQQDHTQGEEGTQPDMPAYDEDLQDILVLHTGGTIASRVSYQEGGVKPAFEPEDLLQMYPELFDQANVDTEVVAQMLSEDMEPEHWQQIARSIADHRTDYDAIIVGHGTDTMQYTAAALSFMLENLDIPVILVGAQRSSDRPSSDAAMNLLSAATFAEQELPGVFVCMHANMSDDTAAIHRGTRVRKMHTSRRDAFRSIGTDPVATVDYDTGKVELQQEIGEPDGSFQLRDELDTRVSLLKTTPGMEPALLEAVQGQNGVIIEGTGLGHMPVNSFDEHTQHHGDILDTIDEIAEDAVVAMTSQCLNGRVNMNVYDAGVKIQDAGVVSAQDMPPGTAYVKLMWCLGQNGSLEEAKDLFTTNIAGEIQQREMHDDF
ncbi:MAG: Glu-tRNA(Gln) amidotransferase subunit GatD [Candidatus Nanohaloarchaea archaeon]|nr:Glu-tRNA(Gln) amidotransferase subunit GatD [Candidatus Nanohaloarchaea archaeon]